MNWASSYLCAVIDDLLLNNLHKGYLIPYEDLVHLQHAIPKDCLNDL